MQEIKFIAAVISITLSLASMVLYTRDIYRGNTKPHIYTWLIWAIVTTIAFFGQLYGGAGLTSISTLIGALMCIGVATIATRYGTKDITFFDGFCLVLAIGALIPWIFANNLLLSVILATLIDMLAYLPTLRKTWHAPWSEHLLAAQLSHIKHLCSLIALDSYSLSTALYPAALLCMQAIFVLEIMYRRLRLKHKKRPSR
jgi:hypothetical protein